TSAPAAGRCTPRPTPATPGRPPAPTCRRGWRWKSRGCADPGGAAPRPAAGAVGGSPGAAVIRVVLPPHLRTLAGVGREVEVEVPGPVTQRLVLDAVEQRYPMLLGTMRDRRTGKGRGAGGFFAGRGG